MNKYEIGNVKTTLETYEVWAENEEQARELFFQNNRNVRFTGREKFPDKIEFVNMLPVSGEDVAEDTPDTLSNDTLGDDDVAAGGRYADLAIKD